MTPTFLDSVLRGAEALAARDAVGALPDPDLVRRFAADRDAAAFAVLVRRHGPLVWGVCRNLLPADADAEDAFQATFLALVRSAGSVRRSEALGAWLHGVAYRVAMKARRSAARRRQREQVAAVPEPDSPVPDAAWDELQAAVHEEVCRLPEKLRLPFVLCGLQGRQQKDAARQLGWKVGTLSARLTQARQRLLERLARRGVPVGVAAGAAVLGMASGMAAVPNSVCLKALAAAKDPAAASPIVLSLARGVTSMSLTRTKLLAVAVLVAGALTTGVGSRLLSTADAQPSSPAKDAEAEHIKRALDYLRATERQDRWEYKFIPVEKPLAVADLQKVLTTADREGWAYCGSQTLVTDSQKGMAGPHMVFKRPRPGTTAVDERTALGLLLLAQHQQQAAQEAAAAEARAKKQADAQDKAKAVTAEEKAVRAAREAEYGRAISAAHAAEEAERAKRESMDQLDATRKALDRERAKTAELERMIREVRAEQADFLKRMKALEAEKGANRRSGLEPRAGSTDLTVPLKHVNARDAAQLLAKQFPAEDFRVTSNETTNSLVIHATPDVLKKLWDAIAKAIDVSAAAGKAPADGKPADPAAGDTAENFVLKPKHASPVDLRAVLDQVFTGNAMFTAEPKSNSLIITARPAVLTQVKALVEALDVPRDKRSGLDEGGRRP